MCANMERFEENNEKSRDFYVKKIVEKLQSESYTVPTPAQEILCQEALRQLVNLVSSEEFGEPIRDNEEKIISTMHTSSCNVNSHRGQTRRQMLRKILSALKNLERGRLYSPPADNEIGYYQAMRNHIRLMITFDSSEELKASESFHHVTRFSALSGVMELENLSGQLKDISSHLMDMDIRNGFSLKTFMGVKPKFMASTNSWNKGKSNLAFYQHKFILACVDLWSSDLAASPPKIDEKKLYDNVINYVGGYSCSKEPSDKEENVSFHSDDLPYLFHNRIVGVMDNSMRHCMDIISTILAKLSISLSFDNLVGCYENNCRNMVKEFVHQCKALDKDLLDYIADFDRSIAIAKCIHRLISASSTANNQTRHILCSTSEGIVHREIEWELIHALTLSDSVPVEFPDEYMETNCPTLSEKAESENLIVLRGILQYLENIDILYANHTLHEEETDLLNKIWKNVASAVDFFYSAMAYQQRGMMQPSLSSDGIPMLGRQMNEKKQTSHLNFNSWEGYHKYFEMHHNFNNLNCILESIKKGLVEKPIREEVKKNMLCSMNCSMQKEVCRNTCLQRRLRLSSKKHIDW